MAEKSKNQVMGPVYQYFKNHPDTVIYRNDIVAAYPDMNITSFDSAVNRMITNEEYRVFRGPNKGSYIYRSGGNGKHMEEEKPHGQTIPEGRETPGLKPTLIVEEPKSEMQTLPVVLPHEIAVPKIKVNPERRLEYVGRLNHVAGIWRDEHGLLYVAMSLDEYINGKPGKSE